MNLDNFRRDLLDGHERMGAFYRLPESEQQAYWANLRQRIDRERDAKLKRLRRPEMPSDVAERIKRTSPTVYVQTIARLELDPGHRACCPLPDHEDHSRDFRISERGWYCHGCNRGGDIYEFAGLMWSLPPRGKGFKEIQERLWELLL